MLQIKVLINYKKKKQKCSKQTKGYTCSIFMKQDVGENLSIYVVNFLPETRTIPSLVAIGLMTVEMQII